MHNRFEGFDKTLRATGKSIKESPITTTAIKKFNDASLASKALGVAGLSALVATVTQSNQCRNEWGTTFLATLAAVSAVGSLAPIAYQKFFAEQKKMGKSAEKEMTALAPK